MLCKRRKRTLDDINRWISDVIYVTKLEGFELSKSIVPYVSSNVIGICYECNEEEFNRFIRKYNLTVDQIVNGVRFLKSS
jgi:hypothetical protein